MAQRGADEAADRMRVAAQAGEQLAIEGGKPVRATLLPYGRHQVTPEDIEAVVEVLRSDWLTTGPKVEEFERALADYVGAAHAVSFSSGTAALHGACFAAGIGAGDEAITTPLTFCATANALLYQGATPIFADVCEDTLNIDPSEIEKNLTPRTRAVLPVDYAGHPADLAPILDLAAKYRLTVIEDASHALGARYKQRRVGNVSHMSVFSFHPVKHISTGEGGMVTTQDEDLARKLKTFRNHGITSDARSRQQQGRWQYEMVALGCNYRLSDIGAALGISQLERIEGNLARRREIAGQYDTAFGGMDELTRPVTRDEVEHAWHLYPVRLRLDQLRADRAEILRALRAENIGANVHYLPVYQHPYYRERFPNTPPCPIAEAAYESLLTLPMFPAMSDSDVSDVIAAVRKVVNHYRR